MATLAAELPYRLSLEPAITPADRLGLTLFVAVVAHLVLILGVVFVPSDPPENLFSTLDIVLVQHSSETAPEDADFLAQANQDGGGEAEDTSTASNPLPAPFVAPDAVVAAASPPVETVQPEPVEQTQAAQPAHTPPRPEAKPLLAIADPSAATTASIPAEAVPTPRAKPAVVPPAPTAEQTTPETINAATLVSRSLAMASLSAEIDQRLDRYAQRPRRKWISARTREYKYAAYMEAWRLKVERIGNLNYPDEARRKQLAGSLLLEVALNPNGSINDIWLRRSSGHRVLDDAAIRIVKLSAPFAPLPDAILEDTDVLHIERTWRFLSTSQFSSG